MSPWKRHSELEPGEVLAASSPHDDEQIIVRTTRSGNQTTVRTMPKGRGYHCAHTFAGNEIVEVTGERVWEEQPEPLHVVADYDVVRELPAG